MCSNVHKDLCCDVIQLPTMQNNTWFYCCRVLTAVLDPAQDTVIKHMQSVPTKSCNGALTLTKNLLIGRIKVLFAFVYKQSKLTSSGCYVTISAMVTVNKCNQFSIEIHSLCTLFSVLP